MLLSDKVARLIEKLLDEGDGTADLKRNDMAERLGCVPSQINYVISTRYKPEQGYMTESRRGGGGYIRIIRIPMTQNEYLMHFFQAVGDDIDYKTSSAYLQNLIDHNILGYKEAKNISSMISPSSLDKVSAEDRNNVRADMMKHLIMSIMGNEN